MRAIHEILSRLLRESPALALRKLRHAAEMAGENVRSRSVFKNKIGVEIYE